MAKKFLGRVVVGAALGAAALLVGAPAAALADTGPTPDTNSNHVCRDHGKDDKKNEDMKDDKIKTDMKDEKNKKDENGKDKHCTPDGSVDGGNGGSTVNKGLATGGAGVLAATAIGGIGVLRRRRADGSLA